MTVYGLAILWPAGTPADAASEVVVSLHQAFPSDKVELIQVACLGEGANVHIRLNLSPYPRPVVERLMRSVSSAEGKFVELWRMTKESRDAFRQTHLTPTQGATPVKDFQVAAKEVRSHLLRLPKPVPAPVLEEPPASPPVQDPPAPPNRPPTEVAAGSPTAGERRWQRFDCRLAVQFDTPLEFVREHASNICNGGIFIRTEDVLERDSEVALKLTLPDGQVLHTKARVAHIKDGVDGRGVGLEFSREDQEFLGAVDRYIASLLSRA